VSKRKLVYPLLAAGMAILLSSCFVLQSFSILATSISPGDRTKAQFVLHPMQRGKMLSGVNIRNRHQFILVGVWNTGQLTIGKATWGTNGRFDGPEAMPVSPDLAQALSDNGVCVQDGLSFEQMFTGGTLTWKGFMTNGTVNDKGKVDVKAIVQVVLRAAGNADAGNYPVYGVTGGWIDEGTAGVDSGDSFYCTGIASSNVFIKNA